MPGSSIQRPKSVALRGTITQFESGFWSDEKNYTGVDGVTHVRSDSPFTKRSGDMVYNFLLD
jgi:hypothetical protein